jgi:O-antigen ligase
LAVVCSTLLASVAIVAVGWEHFVAFKRDKFVSVEETAESAKLRPILAVVAWNMFLDRPLLGCGYGQYIQESPAYLSDRTTDLPLEKARPYRQHNVFLALLTETGLLGMTLFAALLASWTRTAWRLWQTESAPDWVRQMGLLFLAFEGAYLANAMFQDVSIIPMVNMLLFFFAGAITSLTPWLASATVTKSLRVWVPEGELAVASS